jgi:hypothetical protein
MRHHHLLTNRFSVITFFTQKSPVDLGEPQARSCCCLLLLLLLLLAAAVLLLLRRNESSAITRFSRCMRAAQHHCIHV